MFDLPEETEQMIQLPKTKIFETDISSRDKKVIDRKIKTLYLVNQISCTTIPMLDKGEKNENINFVLVELKEELDIKDLEILFNVIKQTVIFVLSSNASYRFVAKYDTIMVSGFADANYKITLKGNDIDSVYDNLIIDLFNIELFNNNCLIEQVRINVANSKINDKIKQLENKLNKETQFNKKVELNREINKLKKSLSEV